MPTASTRYVTWVSRGRRHHGTATAEISPVTSSTQTLGDTYHPSKAFSPIPWTDSAGNAHNGIFAFWSVTGGTDGALVTTDSQLLPIKVGNTDIIATAWYIETGGGGSGGGPGVSIDAFDVNIGNFVDDDFVKVQPDDASHSLTTIGNNEGFISTISAEDIIAFNSIHSVPFFDWKIVVPSTGVLNSGEDLHAPSNSSSIAFAFYKTPSPRVIQTPPANSVWVSYGVTVDAGGPTGHGPVDPWGPFVLELAAGLALGQIAEKVSPKLRSQVLEIAAKQVALASESIGKKMHGS